MAASESEHIHHGTAHGEGHGGISGGHYPGMWVFPNPRVMTRDMAEKVTSMPKAFTMALLGSLALLVLGIVGFIARAPGTGSTTGPPGAITCYFLFRLMITRLRRWGKLLFGLPRALEAATLPCNLNCCGSRLHSTYPYASTDADTAAICEPRPVEGHDLEIRRTIWFEGPIGAPHAWDLAGVIGLAVTALAILWLSAVPDMAEARNTATGFRGWLYRILAGHWYGTKRQWNAQKAGLALLGAFYFMTLIFVHFIIRFGLCAEHDTGLEGFDIPGVLQPTGFQVGMGRSGSFPVRNETLGRFQEYYGKSRSLRSASRFSWVFDPLLGPIHRFAFLITYCTGGWWWTKHHQVPVSPILRRAYLWRILALRFAIPFLILLWKPGASAARGSTTGRYLGGGGCVDVQRKGVCRWGKLR